MLGRTPASRRMYPKESDILNQSQQYVFLKEERSSHFICDDSEVRISRYSGGQCVYFNVLSN